MDVLEESMMVIGNLKQPWIIDRDKICCEYKRQLTVATGGSVTAGVRCLASEEDSNNSWLFDHR